MRIFESTVGLETHPSTLQGNVSFLSVASTYPAAGKFHPGPRMFNQISHMHTIGWLLTSKLRSMSSGLASLRQQIHSCEYFPVNVEP